MVRLQPVEDLIGELVLQVFAAHARLVDKELSDENLNEGMADFVVLFCCGWRVRSEVNFRAARR